MDRCVMLWLRFLERLWPVQEDNLTEAEVRRIHSVLVWRHRLKWVWGAASAVAVVLTYWLLAVG